MEYLEVISNYPPYMAAGDKRGSISQYYGNNGHTGVDSVGNLLNMPVCAIFDGKIVSAGYTSTTGYNVTYQSTNGRVKVEYLHLREKVTVSGSVKKNQIIGREWDTGTMADGKHLHLTMYIDGARVDPLPYLKGTKALPLDNNNNNQGGSIMKYKVGDQVKVKGKIAPSAYSTAGTVSRSDTLKITKIYEGANFPYQLGVVGFTRDQDIEESGGVSQAQYDAVVKENAALKAKIANAQAAVQAVENALK